MLGLRLAQVKIALRVFFYEFLNAVKIQNKAIISIKFSLVSNLPSLFLSHNLSFYSFAKKSLNSSLGNLEWCKNA